MWAPPPSQRQTYRRADKDWPSSMVVWLRVVWLRREVLIGFVLGAMATRSLPYLASTLSGGRTANTTPLPSVSPLLLEKLTEGGAKRQWRDVERLLVIPGGGPGDPDTDNGFPLWTRQRTQAALQEWRESCAPFDSTRCAVLALSAGSMNAPSPRNSQGHVLFESTLIAEHLVNNGVPPEAIICDWASWDTVGNAWFTRLVAESLVHLASPDRLMRLQHRRSGARQQVEGAKASSTSGDGTTVDAQPLLRDVGVALRVTCFISDFHAARTHAALDWVFGLSPTVGSQHGVRATVDVVTVTSQGVQWEGAESFADRIAHESAWEIRLRRWATQGLVTSTTELQAYLLLGAHRGYYDITHGSYRVSSGGGWGKGQKATAMGSNFASSLGSQQLFDRGGYNNGMLLPPGQPAASLGYDGASGSASVGDDGSSDSSHSGRGEGEGSLSSAGFLRGGFIVGGAAASQAASSEQAEWSLPPSPPTPP